jgi:hypothetical protein
MRKYLTANYIRASFSPHVGFKVHCHNRFDGPLGPGEKHSTGCPVLQEAQGDALD